MTDLIELAEVLRERERLHKLGESAKSIDYLLGPLPAPPKNPPSQEDGS